MGEYDVNEYMRNLEMGIEEKEAEIERLSAALDLSEEYNQQKDRQIARLTRLVRDIDTTLRVPAAEYVPAIGDVFELIDRAGMRARAVGE